jgi:hypothetical protein
MNSPAPCPPPGWVWDGTKWVCCDQPPTCQIPPWGPWAPPWFGPQAPPWYPGAAGGITFSATAPENAIRGHMWWDGHNLFLFDGAVWLQVSMPVGVTDGSEPSPGQPGEFLFSTNQSQATWDNAPFPAQPDPTIMTTCGVLLLPPGDWNVWCGCSVSFSPTPLADERFQARLVPPDAPVPREDWVYWPRAWAEAFLSGAFLSFTLGAIRMNRSAPVNMMAQVSSPKAGWLTYYISARRVR